MEDSRKALHARFHILCSGSFRISTGISAEKANQWQADHPSLP